MLYKRYSNVNELLSTFNLDNEFYEFVDFLIKESIDEKLWEVWVNKDTDLSFDDFKKKSIKRSKAKVKALSKEEEERIMKDAEDILNMEVNL